MPFRYDVKTSKYTLMYKSILHTVCLLNVSVTHVAIFKGCITNNGYVKILRNFWNQHRHKKVNFKNNTWFKIHTKINPKRTGCSFSEDKATMV